MDVKPNGLFLMNDVPRNKGNTNRIICVDERTRLPSEHPDHCELKKPKQDMELCVLTVRNMNMQY